MRGVKLGAVLGLSLVLGACDWGPRGPGQLRGVVSSGAVPIGAIVLEVSGPGVRSFSDAGQTRVFYMETQADVYRVVLVAANLESVRFRVTMDDVRSPPLTVSTVEAVDGNNEPIADLSGVFVELRR
ncbi:MAG TPA: hypothetical protein EYQ64_09440 [Gemmatimonadetes bacterium]|nr:hypothetical protein [Gemmatimonadota bacterium]